jgi:nitrogen fixation protein FixH
MSMVMSDPRKRMQEDDTDYGAGGAPLDGAKVLAMIVGFFLFVGAVDGVMIYEAVTTFSGEVVAHPYERGLAYNRDIARAREQSLRDWSVEARLSRLSGTETGIRVIAKDAAGADVTGAEVRALFAAPADLAKDIGVTLTETEPGRYVGRAAAPAGQKDFVLTISRKGEEIFRSKNRIGVE